jgi:hypothetical protein
VSEDTESNKQRGRNYEDACYEEILKEKGGSFFRQTSVLSFFFKLPSGTRSPPRVLLVIRDNDPDDPSRVQEVRPKIVIYLSEFIIFVNFFSL